MATSTLENVREMSPRTGIRLRRAGTALLVSFLVAGLLGLLGDGIRTTRASEGGYTLELEYARTARPGLDMPWSLEVTSEEGFGTEIVVRVTSDYFSIFEHQGIDPAPSAETTDGTYTYWTFDAPDGDTFAVDIDHYVQPASQVGASGVVALMVDGEAVSPIAFTTTLFP